MSQLQNQLLSESQTPEDFDPLACEFELPPNKPDTLYNNPDPELELEPLFPPNKLEAVDNKPPRF